MGGLRRRSTSGSEGKESTVETPWSTPKTRYCKKEKTTPTTPRLAIPPTCPAGRAAGVERRLPYRTYCWHVHPTPTLKPLHPGGQTGRPPPRARLRQPVPTPPLPAPSNTHPPTPP